MAYRTTDELNNFDFNEAVIAEFELVNSCFRAYLDNVTILETNSMNRDIRQMRANNLTLTIPDGEIITLIEEGYKVFDADGNLRAQYDDKPVEASEYASVLKELSECELYSIEKLDDIYVFSINTEDHTYLLKVKGSSDIEEWERFLNK